MILKETLKNLGLEEKEADIYLALLEVGESSVLEIAKKSGVKRPTAYVVLQALEQKGFISKIIKSKKTLFIPQHPRKLVAEAEIHLKEMREIMPQMESLFRREKGRPRVMIYEGKEELDRAYDEAFIAKGEIVWMGSLKLSQEAFPRTFRKIEYVKSES
jgi:sugar-specific transcriptional regulator TrmB